MRFRPIRLKRFRRRPIKKPVTILVGLIVGDIIVLASDSQTTYSSSFGATKRLNADKITELSFMNAKALVAQAGDANLSARAVEMMVNKAKGIELTDYRTVATLAEICCRELKEHLRWQQLDCSPEELRDYVSDEQMDFELMIAHFYNNKPHIFTIDFTVGVANYKQSAYVTSGCGAGIADYLLSWFDLSKLTPTQGILTAIYAVEEVKKVDPYCGGPTKVAGIDNNHVTKFLGESNLSKHIQVMAEVDREARAEWGKRMDEVLKRAAKKIT